jgi:NADP-dependent 3-hydroxy acid dehydrogenase YdfG
MALRGLEGKVAVVTGAAEGIGAATARRLHQEGVKVALVDVRTEPLEQLAAELGDDALALTPTSARLRTSSAIAPPRSSASAGSTWRCSTRAWRRRCP